MLIMDLFNYETLLKLKKFLKMKIQKKLSILLKNSSTLIKNREIEELKY